MVTTTASVQIEATLKDSASRGLNALNGNVKSLSGGAAAATGSTSKLSGALGGINPVAIAAAAGVAALSAAVVGGVKEFVEFEKTIQNATTLIGGDATEAANRFQDAVANIATVVPKDANELGAGLYDILSAGISEADGALQFLEQSGKLATAGLADTSESVDLMTSAFNAFKNEGLDAGQISDILFKTVEKGKTTVSELARSFGQVAPVANAAGVSFSELQAATAALTTQGIRTSQAQQGLKAAFSNIIKPSSEAAQLAEELGISFNTTALQSQGLSGFLQSVQEATGGNVDTMAKLFGSVEGLNAVLALTSQTGGQAFTDTLAEINNAAGSTEEAFQKQTQTLSAQFQLLKSSLFQAFLPALRAVTGFLAQAAAGFNSLIQSIRGTERASQAFAIINRIIAPFRAALQGTIGVFRGLVEGLRPAIDFLKVLGERLALSGQQGSASLKAYEALGKVLSVVGFVIGKILGTAITGLVVLLTGLVSVTQDAGTKIGQAFQNVGAFFSRLFAAVKNGFGSVAGFVRNVVNNVLDRLGILGDAIRKIVSFGAEVKDTVGEGFKAAGNAIKNFFTPGDAVEPVREAVTQIQQELDTATAQTATATLDFQVPEFTESPLAQAVASGQVDAEAIQALETQVQTSMNNIGASVTQGSQQILAAFLPIIQQIVPAVIDAFRNLGQNLSPILEETTLQLKSFTQEFLRTFNELNAIPNFMTLLVAKTTDVLNTGFTAAFNNVIDITNTFMQTMINVMQDGLNALISAVNSVVDQFNAAARLLSQDVFQNIERRVATEDGGVRIVRDRRLLFGGINLPELQRISALNVEAPQAQRLDQPAPTQTVNLEGFNINIETLNTQDAADRQDFFDELNRLIEQKLQSVVRL